MDSNPGCRIVGADETPELWQPPKDAYFTLEKTGHFVLRATCVHLQWVVKKCLAFPGRQIVGELQGWSVAGLNKNLSGDKYQLKLIKFKLNEAKGALLPHGKMLLAIIEVAAIEGWYANLK